MNIMTILDVAASTVAQAVPQGADGAMQGAPAGGGMMWIMLILIFVVMWFFMIRPQRKQQKELQKFREGLKKGDKVVTVGGIYGVVDQVNDKNVLIKVDGDIKLRVAKDSLVKDFSEAQQQ